MKEYLKTSSSVAKINLCSLTFLPLQFLLLVALIFLSEEEKGP